MLSQTLLEILVCPVCHHSLTAGPDRPRMHGCIALVVAATIRLRMAFR